MKPKQNSTKKFLDINSARAKRLLKWIKTTAASTGGVTYTQVKKFLVSTERQFASSNDVKDVLNNFLDQGRLQKIGYKFVLPQSPKKNQVSKKLTVKKSAENPLKQNQNVTKSPVITIKRSPGILDVRDTGIMKFLNKFFDHGQFHSVGKKYMAPHSSNKKQVSKKSSVKSNTANIYKQTQSVSKVVEDYRSPGIFDVHDKVMTEICSLEENASNMDLQSIDTEVHSTTVYAEAPVSSQTSIDSEEPPQNAVTTIPSQNTETDETNGNLTTATVSVQFK